MKRIDYYAGLATFATVILIGGNGLHLAHAQKAATQTVISAQAFQLTDKKGNVKGSFDLDSDGNPEMVMYDSSSFPRVLISVEGDGLGSIGVSGKDHKLKAFLSENSDGTGMILLRDHAGHSRQIKPLSP